MSRACITVRFRCGTHLTRTVQGQRASSTAGYEEAARALCAKLYPNRSVALRLVARSHGEETFEAIVGAPQ